MPGHIFPLRARNGGVLVRSGHTEGSVDLARLAGRESAAVICEIMRDDGEMARMPDLLEFARKHQLPVVKIADLIEYRLAREMLVRPAAESLVRPRLGGVTAEFRACLYTTDVERTEYLALVLGDISPDEPVLVRVQTANVLRDVFGATTSDDEHPATVPLRMIEDAGKGILLYVFPRGRASIRPEVGGGGALPSATAGETDSRLRDFGLGAQVLAHLGARRIRLLTNHPRRIVGLGGYGLEIVECVAIRPAARVMPLRDPAVGSGGRSS
jgi:3,4-dihydroxy 2-butanone 4-phosphate synthase/GTP cyclohydrolase II